MSIVIVLLIIGYVLFAYYIARSYIVFREEKSEMSSLEAKEAYQKYLIQEDFVLKEKKILEDQFRELFTLYDMTRKITKIFKEEDAFFVFREELKKTIDFNKCDFLEPLSKEVSAIKKEKNAFIFPLRGKKSMFGYIVVWGADGADHGKAEILVNQFALVLRRIYLYKEVERLAITDSLTQIFTRRHMMERFEEEFMRARLKNMKLSFLMLDVDLFKQVNDRYGHLVGDSVLRSVSKRILENIREIDIAGRYGGEEFCVVLPDTDSAGAGYVAERVRKSVEEKLVVAYDARVKVTVSIGVATFPKDGKQKATLIDRADWALYRAKKLGRNQVCVFGVYDE